MAIVVMALKAGCGAAANVAASHPQLHPASLILQALHRRRNIVEVA
ncbi:hypothetical protein [Bradyrhizobium australiense]|uniref:Uncharacterized protein n=1 Tax=Bradyrhizobium australiense TaxID=2721161 RepID=A0A7Y4GVU6_9BRAD|nr:hypothetical protein [Bradyrhizobium australiense]NOJ42935.1 hypothetical protein [Bradyrhizobium australiense]